MITAGAAGLGLVTGWAVEFAAWSWAGAAYRVVVVAAILALTFDLGVIAMAFGSTGFIVGATIHGALREAIRRRQL
jgi:predicted GNAT superfamily acetyltransferase